MKQKFKRLACALTLAVTVCTCQAFIGTTNVYATPISQGKTTIDITNGDFNSQPTATYLDTSPNGWTSGSGSAKKGIISVQNSSFSLNSSSSYNLSSTENPDTPGEDNKVLMINARKDNVNDTNKSTIDSFTSDEINLDAYSYYKLSVHVNTLNTARASVVLEGLTEDNMLTDTKNAYFSDIKTPTNAWKEYTYFISTNEDSQTVKLKLALGVITPSNQIASFDAAFFDEVRLEKCSENYFNKSIQDSIVADQAFSEISYDRFDITPDLNFNFEKGMTNWEQFGTYSNDKVFTAETKSVGLISEGADFSINNQKALVLSADKDNKVHVGFKSEVFDIKMAKTYRISVMAKATDLNGSANIKFVETDYLEETYGNKTAPTTSTITFSSTTENALTNGYQEFVFYVSGYELYDTQAQLEVSLGEESVSASGTVVFDSIKIMECSHSKFESVDTSSDKTKKVTLSTITEAPSFTNGVFNLAHADKINFEYPLVPSEWTQSETDNNTVFGVVNTTKWAEIPDNKKPFISSPLNPSVESPNGTVIPVASTSSNNILMVYNKPYSKQVVTSPTFTAEMNKYYNLTFNYYTFGNALSIKVLDADQNIVFEDTNLASTTAWETYKVTFRTEHFSVETLSVVITLDNKESSSSAYALFDNFQFYTLDNFNLENFQTAIDTNKNTVDLSNLGIHQTGKQNSVTSIYDATLFNGKLESGTQNEGADPIAVGGIINEVNNFGVEFPSTHTNAVQNMVILQTHAIADYTLTSKNTISLTAGNYYKFSVYVKTSFNNLPVEDQAFGAYFKLIGLKDASLTKIVSGTMFDQYIIYVTPNEDAKVNVQFGLKSEGIDSLTALFDTFEFSTIEKTDFNKAVTSNNVLVLAADATETEEEEDKDDTTNSGYGTNIWIEVSTLLMILAIVIAVVGGLIRKKKSKKIKVKKQAEYAQKAAMVRDSSLVEAERRRDQEIANLVKEKQELHEELKELEAENKQRLAENRRLSGKQITRKAEKEFKLYASNRQRIVRDIGRIDERIKDAQTEGYLHRIAKLVQAEKVKEMENKPTIQTQPSNDSDDE
ncbi:MAG: hypothetical protein IJF22_00770 [Clostridia bacterium]|nr:hypothetical protein [Clostridia bacterium]